MNITAIRGIRAAALLALAVTAWPVGVAAQEPVDSMRAELERLRARVDSLAAELERLRAAGADTVEAATELEAIRAAAAAAAGRGEAAPDTAGAREFVGRQRNQQALNPEVTVTGDLFGFLDLDDPGEEAFVPRAVEFSFQSALDPYSLAKVFVGYHGPGGELAPFGGHEEEAEGHGHEDEHADEHDAGEEPAGGHGHGGGLTLEEAYVQWRGLPGGFNVNFGRFRQNFTPLNRWHPHALPGQSYPLPILAFFGEEGLAQTGVGVHWLAPFDFFGTWEVWTEVTASGNEALFGEARSLSFMGRANVFWDLSASTYLEMGGGAVIGPDRSGDEAFQTAVVVADFTLSWRPPARSRYREATLRGGVMVGEVEPGPERDVDHRLEQGAWGGFANAEYRLDRRWIVGGRAEYSENPLHPEEASWLIAPTVTWWQSEWVRLRLEFDYLDRPDGAQRLLVLQATFAMGPHKHETY